MHYLSFLLLTIAGAKKLSEREVGRQQDEFRHGHASPDELSMFDDPVVWTKVHTSSLFKGLDGRGMHKWVKWLGDQSRDRRIKFIQGHTVEDLAQLGAKEHRDYGSACNQLAGLADHLSKTQIEGLKEDCAAELVKGLVFAHPAWLGQLPKSVLQDQAERIVANLEKNIAEVKPETLAILLSDPDVCKHLTAKQLPLLTEPQAKRINGKCFAAIKEDWDTVEFTAKQLAHFNTDLFEWSQQPDLPESLFQHLRKEQLRRWGVRLEKEEQCRNLRIDVIKPASLSGLTSQCMAGMIRGMLDNSNDKPVKKGKRKQRKHINVRSTSLELGAQRWAALRTDIFSGLDPTDELTAGLALIPEEEWKRMPVALIEGILSMKGACLALPAAASLLSWSKLARPALIDARCFAELNPAIQPAILQHLTSLPDDLLKHVGKSHIRRWEQGGKEGLDCLTLLKSRSNRASLMANLSRDLAHAPEQSQWAGQTKHACAAITNLSQISDLSISLTAECVDAIPELTDDADLLKRAPAIIVAKRGGLDRLHELVGEGEKQAAFWSSQTATSLAPFASLTEAWCARIDTNIWSKLPDAALPAISGSCYAALKITDKRTRLPLCGPDALSHLDRDQAQGLDWNLLREDQLDQLSEAVTDDAKHAGPVLITDLQKASPARCAHLSARTWSLLPPGHLKGLSGTQVKDLPADRLTLWTAAHLRAVPLPAISALQADQVRQMGINIKDEPAKKALVDALVAIGGKIDDQQARRAIEERSKVVKTNAAHRITASLSPLLLFPLLMLL